MHSWGSRGRRFKSGRPDRSEPHFRTQKQDCDRLMGAQRAPISRGNRRGAACGRPNATGQGPAEPASGAVHPGALASRSKGPPVPIRPSRRVLGNTSQGPRRDKAAALADAVRQPRSPAISSAPSFGRSLPPLAGPVCRLPACSWQKTSQSGPMLLAGDTVQPSLGPLGLNSSPNLWICECVVTAVLGGLPPGSVQKWPARPFQEF
jgi:hypothetical protein